ncbi:MAG TPA: hypothetical protein VN281_05925, partial [Verrucomicrobiae bacterium]|nr:hypothetical protein [Verrucomicrobiae bacterium]
MPPCHDLSGKPHDLTVEVSLREKQISLLHAKDVGEKFDLFVYDRAPLCLNVGQHIARHVASEQLQLSGEFVLSPTSLITKLGDVSSNYIFVV